MMMISAWLDGGSSHPEAKVEVAEYVEDTEQTYVAVWAEHIRLAEVVLDDDGVRELIRALSMRLGR